MSDCASTYTIDTRTGEKLVCERHLIGRANQVVHCADKYSASWVWYTKEEDK